MKQDLFEIILSLSFQQKIDMLRISLTSAVCPSFAHIDGLVQTTPKCSQLKDQKTGVIDEPPSDINTLLIDDMYSLWFPIITRKVSFANKINFKECMCAISRKRFNKNFIEAPTMFTTTLPLSKKDA